MGSSKSAECKYNKAVIRVHIKFRFCFTVDV